MTDKRAAALAAFDRILEARRLALATNEKALAAFEVKSMQVGDTRVVMGGGNRMETDFIRQLVGEIDHARNVIAVQEWEREVLFGPQAPQDPRPCPEYPDCGDDEGPCYACSEYQRHLDAVETAREVSDAG